MSINISIRSIEETLAQGEINIDHVKEIVKGYLINEGLSDVSEFDITIVNVTNEEWGEQEWSSQDFRLKFKALRVLTK